MLLQTETAEFVKLRKGIKIHEYKGKNMEIVNEFWKVDKLTNFENVSVSRPVNFGSTQEIAEIISLLLGDDKYTNAGTTKEYQLRYLMCSGPPFDLSALFNPTATIEQKKNAQKLLSAPQICEKLIMGCAVFDGRDYKQGYLVKNRVIH